MILIDNRNFTIQNLYPGTQLEHRFIRVSGLAIIKFADKAVKVIYRITFISNDFYISIFKTMDLKARVLVEPISSKENQSELARYSFAFIKGKPL